MSAVLPALLVKLGSIARHAEELLSPTGHAAHGTVIEALLADPDLQECMAWMDEMALLPVKR